MASFGSTVLNRLLLLAAGCAVVGCASPMDNAYTEQAVELPLIEYQVTSWGRTIARVTVSPDGVVVRDEIEPNSGDVTMREEARLSLDGHRAAVAALEPLRNSTQRDFGCPSPTPTDLPTAIFRWDGSGRVSVYFGCYDQLHELADAEHAFWEIVDGAFPEHEEPLRSTKD